MKNLTPPTNTAKQKTLTAGIDFAYADKVRAETQTSGVSEKVTHRPTLKRIAQMLTAAKK